MSFIKEFKEFAMKGNVMDLAVGIIIGGAFGKIISSLVADIIMPPIGVIIGGIKFTDIKLGPLNIGNFIQATFDFMIIAVAIFLLVKMMNKLNRKKVEKAPTPKGPSEEVLLLTEIRDLLKKQ